MAKIVEVKPLIVNSGRGNLTFVRVRTDDGFEGVGEGTIPHKARAIAGAVEEFAIYLLGKDPSQIERHWQVIYRNSFHRGGPIQSTALSAIDQALWDIRGKVLNRPVWDLLGGAVRDRIRIYTHPSGATPDAVVARARALYGDGHRSFKLQVPATPEPVVDERAVAATIDNFRAVRDALPDVELMVDGHGKLTPHVALRIAEELAPFRPLFFEEPVPPDNIDALAEVARRSPVPIATGERYYNRWDFRTIVEKQAAAIIQPDLGHAGGISEVRRIAAAAEVYYIQLAPHNPRGAGVTMASLHIAACTPNFVIQETTPPDELWAELMVEPWRLEDGHVGLPQAPGLGLRFDESLAERFPFQPRDVRHPVLRDGGVGDW